MPHGLCRISKFVYLFSVYSGAFFPATSLLSQRPGPSLLCKTLHIAPHMYQDLNDANQ